jgi:hypothetical protein
MTWRLAYVALFLPAIAACAADTFVTGDGGSAAADAGDAATGPACGPSPCAQGQTCCVTMANSTPSYACLAGCPTGGGGGPSVASLACASAADCAAGYVCCMEQSNGSTQSACASHCGVTQVQLCDPGADAGCPLGLPCSTSNIGDWNLPPTFGTCGGRGVP